MVVRSFEQSFFDQPTNPAAASGYFEQIRALAHVALEDEENENYWQLTARMKFVGKFLPISDPRNPDSDIYTARQQG